MLVTSRLVITFQIQADDEELAEYKRVFQDVSNFLRLIDVIADLAKMFLVFNVHVRIDLGLIHRLRRMSASVVLFVGCLLNKGQYGSVGVPQHLFKWVNEKR